MSEEYRNALPKGTIVDTYQIDKVLGVGGFGVAYLAHELNLNKTYAIKELMPDGIAIRQAGDSTVLARSQNDQDDFDATRKYFVREAKVLASIQHPAVVGVHRLFEANGTCYMVMDYVEGCTLTDHLKKRGGKIKSKDEFESIFYPVMDGISVLHAKELVHRDIKPGNIMVKPDGSPVLLDFGAATQVQSKTMTVTQMLSAGYSPFEQYTSKARQGPYTDIYALGATMVRCITGEKPDDASDRVYDDGYKALAKNKEYLEVYGKSILSAVDKALLMNAKKRPQTVETWREMMMPKGGAFPPDPVKPSSFSKMQGADSGAGVADTPPVNADATAVSGKAKNDSKQGGKGGKSSRFAKMGVALLVIVPLAGWAVFYQVGQSEKAFLSKETPKKSVESQEQQKAKSKAIAREAEAMEVLKKVESAISQGSWSEAQRALARLDSYQKTPAYQQKETLTRQIAAGLDKARKYEERLAKLKVLKQEVILSIKARRWEDAERKAEELKSFLGASSPEMRKISRAIIEAKTREMDEKEREDLVNNLNNEAADVLTVIESSVRSGGVSRPQSGLSDQEDVHDTP
ncbi:MAG: protein kinase [Akkermansiaceae bacterium]|nr:protein kinase [Akkermansiaceae bacterium]